MITREQATATLADFEAAGLDGRIPDLARTVVALHDEVERLRAEVAKLPATVDQTVNLLRLAEASVSLLRADLDDHVKAEVVAGEMGPDESGDLYITVRVPLAQNRAFPMGAVLRVLRAAVPGSV